MRTQSRCLAGARGVSGELLGSRLKSLRDIVRDYRGHDYRKLERELGEFRNERSLRRAIRRAGLAQDAGGKKLRHQYLIPPDVLTEWSRILLRYGRTIGECRSFAELHEFLRKVRRKVRGIGRLTVYDTALRIGSLRKLNLAPEAVYLHAGAKVGAKAMGFAGRERAITRGHFPKEFRSLKPYEIEHCLCVYRRELRRLRRAGKIQLS